MQPLYDWSSQANSPLIGPSSRDQKWGTCDHDCYTLDEDVIHMIMNVIDRIRNVIHREYQKNDWKCYSRDQELHYIMHQMHHAHQWYLRFYLNLPRF